MRKFIFAFLFSLVSLPALANQPPIFLDFVKDGDGGVKYMSQEDAVRYCAGQGNHLPTPRELAQLAISMGAKGIVEVCDHDIFHSDEFINWDQCTGIEVWNADGSRGDSFLYSWKGMRFDNNSSPRLLWSSSIEFDKEHFVPDPYRPYYFYALDTSAGNFSAVVPTKAAAVNYGIGVRCVLGR